MASTAKKRQKETPKTNKLVTALSSFWYKLVTDGSVHGTLVPRVEIERQFLTRCLLRKRLGSNYYMRGASAVRKFSRREAFMSVVAGVLSLSNIEGGEIT